MTTKYGRVPEAVTQIAQALKQVLANGYVVYIKTLNFHWNLVDPRFQFLHEFFQTQYEALADAQDELAERIRILGHRAPGSMEEFLELATIEESRGDLSGDQMLKELASSHEKLIDQLHEVIVLASEGGDEGTADLLTSRLRDHEKTVWMIKSHRQ